MLKKFQVQTAIPLFVEDKWVGESNPPRPSWENMVQVKENISLAPYTIYKIGGPARYLAEVEDSGELKEALEFAARKGVKFFILGAGSNVLVNDKGFDGLVIKINLREVRLAGSSKLLAESGVSMAQAVLASAQAGLTGFEWGIGIPGTVGGSVRGNAGCFGGEMKDVVGSVTVINSRKSNFPRKFDFLTLDNSECKFAYRDSVFKRYPEWVILSATLNLKKGNSQVIQENIKRITAERAQKQDIGTKSCGCIFKNVSWEEVNKEVLLKKFPELEQFAEKPTIPASYLIDRSGLKGRRVGQVFISPKHANYFVNEGGATAGEVVQLIVVAKEKVQQTYGVNLEEEIHCIGF